MPHLLNIEASQLQTREGYWTAKEIAQQPAAWLRTAELIENQRNDLNTWLAPLLARDGLRIILTGAGTSAYVGESVAPHLARAMSRQIEAISTTDLVTNPDQYFLKSRPTLLVSYARSGNSPESVGAYDLADQLVEDCYHLVVTCNRDGELASRANGHPHSYCLLMPEETQDQSFAMTSSFTSMLLATLAIFSPDTQQMNAAVEISRQLLDRQLELIKQRAGLDFRRIVFLGSGGLKGIATEAALKMLELSAGKIDCYAESPLGFRHGPKSMLDDRTVVVMLNCSCAYRERYESDLFRELRRDGTSEWLHPLAELVSDGKDIDDVWLSFPYILYAQLLAFFKSLSLNITPDNPCPSGEVNRVVQGVTIYPFEA